jgi:hypothetical protein
VTDEPGVEPHAISRAEPDVLVGELKAGRRDRVRARQAREHGHVDEALLKPHQCREADRRHAPAPYAIAFNHPAIYPPPPS